MKILIHKDSKVMELGYNHTFFWCQILCSELFWYSVPMMALFPWLQCWTVPVIYSKVSQSAINWLWIEFWVATNMDGKKSYIFIFTTSNALRSSFTYECKQNTRAALVAPLTLSLIETTDIFISLYSYKISQNISIITTFVIMSVVRPATESCHLMH